MSPIRVVVSLALVQWMTLASQAVGDARAPLHPRVTEPLTVAAASDSAQLNPAAVADGAGGVLIAWEDHRSPSIDIYVKRLDASGAARWPSVALCAASGNQTAPKIVSDGAGGAIVTWQDFRGGTNADIYAQHVLASGVVDPAWPANGRALCTAANTQINPAMVPDAAGGAIVAWSDTRSGTNSDIYAQHVLATGAVDSRWPINGLAVCVAVGNQQSPTIVADGADSAIVAWEDYRSGAYPDIYAQHVLATGAVDSDWPVNGLAVCAAADGQYVPTIASDAAGGAVVTWEDHRSGTADIYAQRVLARGTVDPRWPADGRALCTAAVYQFYPLAISDGTGGAIVTWEDYRSGTNWDLYAQHVLATGAVDSDWPINGLALCVAANDQWGATIAADGTGGAIVTWQDHRGSSYDIHAQHALPSGVVDPAWTANGIALCAASGDQLVPTIVSDGRGGAIVAWEDRRDPQAAIYARRVMATGPPSTVWTVDGVALCLAVNNQEDPTIASDGAGGAFITWSDYRNGTDFDIYAQHVLASGAVDPTWTANGVMLCGAQGDQVIRAIVADGAGGAIVTWEDKRSVSSGWDIFAQKVLASGAVAPGWPTDGLALHAAANDQLYSRIASDGVGGAIVTWQDFRGGATSDIYAQHVLAWGAVDPTWPDTCVALCKAANDQRFPAIVSDGAGGAIVTWDDDRSTSSRDVYVQHVLASGVVDPVWPAGGRALSTVPGIHIESNPVIVADGAGGAIVAWHDQRGSYSTSYDIYAQHALASGAVDPAWPPEGRALCTAASWQYDPAIASDGTGGAIVTWRDSRNGLGTNADIYAQHVLASGAVDPAWPADGRGLCMAADNQYHPEIVSDGAGGAIVTWEDWRSGRDIYAQQVLASGVVDPSWPADGRALCTAASSQWRPMIVSDGSGGAIVTWYDSGRGTSWWDIYAQRIAPTGPVAAVWTPDGVTSAQLSVQSAEAEPGAVRLIWYTAEVGLVATVYRSEPGGPWSALASLTPDGSGRLRYTDETVTAGRRYGYRLGVRTNGSEEYLGEVWVTTPRLAELSLEGLRPNPAAEDLIVAFSLASAGDATLALLDVSGRRVVERRLVGLAAGSHVVNLGVGTQLAPGLYVVRLTQGGHTLTRKAIVAR